MATNGKDQKGGFTKGNTVAKDYPLKASAKARDRVFESINKPI